MLLLKFMDKVSSFVTTLVHTRYSRWHIYREKVLLLYVVLVWVLLGCVSNNVTVQLLGDQYVHVKWKRPSITVQVVVTIHEPHTMVCFSVVSIQMDFNVPFELWLRIFRSMSLKTMSLKVTKCKSDTFKFVIFKIIAPKILGLWLCLDDDLYWFLTKSQFF